MTQEGLAYFINSYFVKVALVIFIVYCPCVVLAALAGLSLLGVFLTEQITYETDVKAWVEHADKVFVMLSGLLVAIGYMI